MKTRLLILLAGLACTAPFASAERCACCEPTAEEASAKYPLRGLVKEVDAAKATVVVKHEAIPGFMKAMTMEFLVSAADAARLKAGDHVTATLSRDNDDWRLDGIQILLTEKP